MISVETIGVVLAIFLAANRNDILVSILKGLFFGWFYVFWYMIT